MTQPVAPLEDLAARLRTHVDAERILQPTDPGYDDARRIWNGAVDNRPAVIVRVRDAVDVAECVRAARASGVPLSVRGGGHDWAGRALRDGGLVVDLTGMREVEIADGRARFGGGARIGDVVAAAQPHGLVPAVGTSSTVGAAGFALGGGYGPLCGRVGLGSDNIVGAQVVSAEGQIVDTDDDPDLLWALRGGGGNFGVVTELRTTLHPVSQVTAGMILFPWSDARTVLNHCADLIAGAPDELTIQVGVLAGPDGTPMVFVAPTWSGDPAAGSTVADDIARLGSPVLNGVAPTTVADLLAQFDGFASDDLHYEMRTRTVAALTPGVVESLVVAGTSLPTPNTMISLHHFHGASSRRPADSGAFGLRRPHLVVEIIAGRTRGDTTPHGEWAETVWTALGPHALPGGYPNLLGADRDEQIAHAYGANATRLVELKKRYDADRIFTATPLPLS